MSPSDPPASAGGDRPRLAALLVDFDGTLADSLGYLKAVYARFVTELGGEPSAAEFERLNGPPIAEVVRLLCGWHRAAGPVETHLARYNALLDEGFMAAPVLAGADSLLQSAARLGLRAGVVTSNRRGRVEAWLAANRLDALCDVLVSGEDPVAGKPSPEPYLLALERLGIDAGAALAVEDSEAGARAAAGAGLRTLRIGRDGAGAADLVRDVRDLNEARTLIEALAS